MTDRRKFIGGLALGAAAGLTGNAKADGPSGTSAFAELSGREFRGMQGAYAPLYTPFTADDRLNEGAVAPCVEFCLKHGLRGFYVNGSTGEGLLQSVDERKRMMKCVADANKGRGKLIAHVGAMATRDAVELARYAADIGYDWVSAQAPVFFATGWDACYYHFKTISEATDLPFMIYSRLAKIDPEKDARLFDLKNVKGMKYTGYEYWTVRMLKDRLGKEAIFFAGADEQVVGAFGFTGVFSGAIGTTYNTLPDQIVKICELAAAGRLNEAEPYQHRIQRFIEVCQTGNSFSYWKATMRYLGMDVGQARPPSPSVSEEQYRAFAAKLAKLDFLRA